VEEQGGYGEYVFRLSSGKNRAVGSGLTGPSDHSHISRLKVSGGEGSKPF
jgi:hypothetical protein